MAIYRVPVHIAFLGSGSPGANIWHVRTTGNFDPQSADLQSMVTAIRNFYVGCASVLPATATYTLGTVTEVETANEAVPTWASFVGTASGSITMQGLAIVVTWRTSVAARRGRGRTFLGPLPATAVQSDGTINDTMRTTVQTAAAALVTASMGFANGAVGVWGVENSREEGDPPYADMPHVLRDFQGSQVRDLFGILRSRRD